MSLRMNDYCLMKKIFVFIFFLFGVSLIYADKWQAVGARAMSMGGTGVASATGFAQQYYNPALLSTISKNNNDVVLNINAEIDTTDKVLILIEKINNMTDKYESIINKIKNKEYANAIEMISIMDTLKALQKLNLKNVCATADVNVGLVSKFSKFSVSVRTYGSAGVIPIVDKKNIGLVSSVDGIKLDNFLTPISEENQRAADIIKEALIKYDLTESFENLFNLSDKTAQDIANAIVNMTDAAQSTVQDITNMADKIAADLPEIGNILKTLTSGSYKDNESQVLIDAGVFTEVAVGYGYEVYKGIQVGGNLKYIQGQMAQTGIMILPDNQDVGDAISKALDNKETSNQIGLDLGAFIDISGFADRDIFLNPKFGITARNINNPYFERPDKPLSEKYEKIKWNENKYYLGSQLRAGIAINPIEKLTIACDFDLLKNKTFVEGFNSQEFCAGIEFLLLNKKNFILPLRAGINKNIAVPKSNIEYTAGTGIYAFGFNFEIAAGMSENTTTFDGQTIPASASFALNLGYSF